MITGTPTSAEAAAPTDHPPSWRHIPALDGLRGLAVIGVLLFHDGRLDGGFLGVDLFFALSGFLITGLLLDERRRKGTVRLSAFWARRARRLLPAMLVFLVLILPMMALWGTPSQVQDARDGIVPALFYVINWHQIAQSSDYWALFSDPSPMTHLWSLAVEEQFYIVWPLLVAFLFSRRQWRRWLLGVTLTGITASAIAMAVFYDPSNPTRSYIGTDTRASSILLGALLAMVGAPALLQRAAQRSYVAVAALQVAIVVALGAAWVMIDGRSTAWLFQGGMVAHAFLGALLASSIGLEQATPVQRALAVRPLRWFGTISYGLYLWHWPVFILLDERRTGLDGLTLSALRWSLSTAIALVSFHLLEQPVRRDHRRWTTGRVRAGIALTMVAAVAMVFVVPEPATAPAAFDPTSITSPPSTTPPATTPATVAPGSGTGIASTVPAPIPPTLTSLLWQGDSVAFDSAPGVLAAARAGGVDANETTILGLGLVARGDADPVASYRERIAEYRPDLVVLMLSSWDSKASTDEQLAAFAEYSQMVLESGAQLAFITPPPVDPTFQTQDISLMRSLADALAGEQPERVFVLDASALWGDYARDVNGDGIPERKWDGVHVCPQGSAMLGNWVVAQLAARFSGVQPAPPSDWAGGPWTQDPRYSQPAGACA